MTSSSARQRPMKEHINRSHRANINKSTISVMMSEESKLITEIA